jgi:hypothetical protein
MVVGVGDMVVVGDISVVGLWAKTFAPKAKADKYNAVATT